MSATQLNADYQDSETPDQNLLRGAKSIADKIDLGMIMLEVTQKDRESLDTLIKKNGFEMPTIKIQYPILDVITHANAIEVSVGMLYGVGVNQTGNTVIIGHNYNNGLFFGKNKYLQIGDKIYITDIYGNKLEYTVYNKYYTPESDTSYITRQTDGKIEVTLVTCDATGRNRLVVCARVE